MRKIALFSLLVTIFFWTTGAAIIDKETKNGVLELKEKVGALADQERVHHAEEIRLLKELRSETSTIPSTASSLTSSPAASVRPEVRDSLSVLAFILSGISLLLLALFLVMFKRGEERTKKLIWKSELETLRDNVSHGRPHLKIQANAEGIVLINSGETAADDIRLFLGPTPATMRQKVKVIPKMQVGEKVEIPLQSNRSDDLLYATLEYKNPLTGRLFKDQFSLKIDRMTGEMIPIQQAG